MAARRVHAEVTESAHEAIQRVFRAERGRILALLLRVCRDFELAEDAFNDGVLYLETRFSPVLNIKGRLKAHDAVEAVLKGLAAAERLHGVVGDRRGEPRLAGFDPGALPEIE